MNPPIKVKCMNQDCEYYLKDFEFNGIVKVENQKNKLNSAQNNDNLSENTSHELDYDILSGLNCEKCHELYNITNLCNYVDHLLHHFITTYYSVFI